MSSSGAVNLGTAAGYLMLDISGFERGLNSAGQDLEGFNSRTSSSADKIDKLGSTMTSAGSSMTKHVTLPIVAAGVAALKTSADFGAGMSKVSAISGATGSDLDSLKQKAIEMGAKTNFSATDAADAFSFMASAGWDTNQMLSGIDGVMSLAAASGESLATTSDICTNSMTAFGLQADQAGHFADVLAQTSSMTNAEVANLGEAFQYVAPVAGALGYSVEDVSVALGLMANNGIKGSAAGTSLRSIFTNLVKPTDDMAAKMEELGIKTTDSAGNMKPLNQLLTEMRSSFANLTSEQKASAAATLAGKEGMSGLLAVMNASDGDFNKLTDGLKNSDGVAEKMATTMQDNLKGSFTALSGSVETLAIQIGDILSPMIRGAAESVTNFVNWLSSLDEGQKRVVVTIMAVVASIGPMLLIFGKLITGVGSLITAWGTISAAMPAVGAALTAISGPIGWAIAAVVALVAAIVYLYNTNETFRTAIQNAWKSIQEAMSSAWERIKPSLEKLGQAFGVLLKALEPILAVIGFAFVEAFASIVGVINGTIQALSPLIDAFTNVVDFISNILNALWSLLQGNFSQSGDYIMAALGNVVDFVINIFKTLWEFVKGFFSGFLGTITTAFATLGIDVLGILANLWNGFITWWSNLITWVVEWGSSFITSIVSFFVQLPTNIMNFFTQIINNTIAWGISMVTQAQQMGTNFLNSVVTFFTQLPYQVGYFIGFTLASVVLWAVNMYNKAVEMGTNFINAVTTFFVQLPGKVLQFITSTYNNIVTWVGNMVTKAREMGTNFISNVVSFFTQLPGKVQQFITSALNNVVTWAGNMATNATTAASNFLSNVVSGITSLPGKVQEFLTGAINNVITWVGNLATKGAEAASGLLKSIQDGMASLPESMASIGKNVVEGFWNGISGLTKWINDKISNFSSGVIQGIKDALGVKSPSRVTTEIGMYCGLGFGNGMVNEMKNQQDRIQNAVLSATELDVSSNVDSFKSTWTEMAKWFDTIGTKISDTVTAIGDTISDMTNQYSDMSFAADGSVTLGYVGANGYSQKSESPSSDKNPDIEDSSKNDGDTFIFNSPKAISEVEAAKLMKKTKQEIAEGF